MEETKKTDTMTIRGIECRNPWSHNWFVTPEEFDTWLWVTTFTRQLRKDGTWTPWEHSVGSRLYGGAINPAGADAIVDCFRSEGRFGQKIEAEDELSYPCVVPASKHFDHEQVDVWWTSWRVDNPWDLVDWREICEAVEFGGALDDWAAYTWLNEA